jgi:hypothetical protein
VSNDLGGHKKTYIAERQLINDLQLNQNKRLLSTHTEGLNDHTASQLGLRRANADTPRAPPATCTSQGQQMPWKTPTQENSYLALNTIPEI